MNPKLAILALVLAAGCKHKNSQALSEPDKIEVTARPEAQAQAIRDLAANFARVHFDTDSARLDDEGKSALSENAKILQEFPELKVEVQGHADERGTTDYNLALGQRRANSVVQYLLQQGVAPSRLPMVTYGEERPVARGSTEVAWSQNRRAEFRIVTGPSSVHGTTGQ